MVGIVLGSLLLIILFLATGKESRAPIPPRPPAAEPVSAMQPERDPLDSMHEASGADGAKPDRQGGQ
jgi:hypothetical protein